MADSEVEIRVGADVSQAEESIARLESRIRNLSANFNPGDYSASGILSRVPRYENAPPALRRSMQSRWLDRELRLGYQYQRGFGNRTAAREIREIINSNLSPMEMLALMQGQRAGGAAHLSRIHQRQAERQAAIDERNRIRGEHGTSRLREGIFRSIGDHASADRERASRIYITPGSEDLIEQYVESRQMQRDEREASRIRNRQLSAERREQNRINTLTRGELERYARYSRQENIADSLRIGAMSVEEAMSHFGFENLQDVVDANAEKRNATRRNVDADRRRRSEDQERRRRDRKRIQEESKNTAAINKNTKALLKYAVGSFGTGIALKAVSGFLTSQNEISNLVVGNANFTRYNSISPQMMARFAAVGSAAGVSEEQLKNTIGSLSHQLAMSTFKRTDLMNAAAIWGVDIFKDGKSVDVVTLLKRMKARTVGMNPEEKLQFMDMFKLDENMMRIIENADKISNLSGFDGSANRYGSDSMVNARAAYIKGYVEQAHRETEAELANADLSTAKGWWSFAKGMIYKAADSLHITDALAQVEWAKTGKKSFEETMRDSKKKVNSAANGASAIESSSYEEMHGFKTVTINMGGQQFTFSGSSVDGINEQIAQKFGPSLARAIVDQLQLSEK